MREITTTDVLEILLDDEAPSALVFKHSTRCPISAAALRRVEEWERGAGADAPPVWMVRVIEQRPLSNLIAERTGVAHQSPQAMLIRGGRVLWHASHNAVGGEAIDRAIRAAGPETSA